jgi:hypothetical protein
MRGDRLAHNVPAAGTGHDVRQRAATPCWSITDLS